MGERHPPQTVEEMASLVVRSDLLDQASVTPILAAFLQGAAGTSQEEDALSAFSTRLVTTGLTEWQCDKLRRGQWKGFFLDGYELVGVAGRGFGGMIYFARRSRPGELVRLLICPSKEQASGVDYRVM
jgi:hypothetical protein